jgi:hypothetical protein
MAQVAARPVTLELVSAQAQVSRAAKSNKPTDFFISAPFLP